MSASVFNMALCWLLLVTASRSSLTPQLLHAEVGYDGLHVWREHRLIDGAVG